MRRLIMVAALAAGCGGSGGDAPPGATDCGPRTGLYRATYATRDGNCGPISEMVINFDDPPASGCVSKYPTDNVSCRVMGDVTCPADGMPTTKVTAKGVTTWQAGGASGGGVVNFDMTKSDGTVACQGTYDVAYTKL